MNLIIQTIFSICLHSCIKFDFFQYLLSFTRAHCTTCFELLSLTLPDYNCIAGCYTDGGEEEESDGDQGHVQLPVPRLGEVDPALGPVVSNTRYS